MNNSELRLKITELSKEIESYYNADQCAYNARFKALQRRVLKAGVNNSKLRAIYHDLMEELYGDGGLKGY